MTTWNLEDLCPNENEIDTTITNLLKQATLFKAKYINHSEENLLDALKEYEALFEEIYKLMSFGSLKHSIHLDNENIGKLYQKIQNMYVQIKSDLVFFENGLIRSKQSITDPRYKHWIDHLRLYAPHILDDKTESYAKQKSLTSQSAWVRLYDETLDNIKFTIDDRELRLEDVTSRMSDTSPEVRKKAAISLSEGLSTQMNTFVRVINTLVQDHKIENQCRQFKNPDDSKHLDNQIDKATVDLLCETIKENYKNLSHRYYKLKAKLLGQDKLEYWDRNAAMFSESTKDIPYEEAQKIVKDAYNQFSPTLAALVQRFYDNPWIDVYARKGKTSGAFSHPTVPSVHPYILLNYQGKVRDVATLAHELGHGVHQILSGPQGLFLSDTPLTIAETASVFGEMLTFESMKKIDAKRLLASKIEDMLNTVVRQIAFYEFEKKVHRGIQEQGELTSSELCTLFRQTQAEALGPYVNLAPIIDSYWAYISHFIHSPFYVYAYAFGDCLVNSLYAKYRKTSDKKDFEQKYLNFLKAGGSQSYIDLLKPFGLNPKEKSFWEAGLQVIIDMIDEFEELVSNEQKTLNR